MNKLFSNDCQHYALDRKNKIAGKVIFERLIPFFEYDIVDYIRNGLCISLAVSIDFTASNGTPPGVPSSLHHLRLDGKYNSYQNAILQVGTILNQYDQDQRIIAFGFGADVGRERSDLFNLNFKDSPVVNGIRGLLDAYCVAVPSIDFSGPTNFSPTIRQIKSYATATMSQTPLIYHVLLIITDGNITDEQPTKDAIVASSDLPISIIIVGVGNDSFDKMDELDTDRGQLNSSFGQRPSRDIVQFVRFNDYEGNSALLAQKILKELPRQMNRFYSKIGLFPKAL